MIERFLFYLLVFMVPFQRRLILYRFTVPVNEWATAYLYVTDIIIILLLSIALWRGGVRWHPKKPILVLGAFVVMAIISIIGAPVPMLGIYTLVRLCMYICLFLYVISEYDSNSQPVNRVFTKSFLQRRFSLATLAPVALVSGALQAAIALLQYVLQTSVGFRWLGESPLTPGAYGVASFYVDNMPILRAYGTTPHPNILALILALALILSWQYIIKLENRFQRWLTIGLHTLILLGLCVTYSRTVIIFWLGAALALASMRYIRSAANVRTHIRELIIATACTLVIFTGVQWPAVHARMLVRGNDTAVAERLFFARAATSITRNNLLLGVGYGNFVPKLMAQYVYRPSAIFQPVHNIYLLLASETGIMGLGLFLAFWGLILRQIIKRKLWPELITLSMLLAIGFFDHLLWTSQQGMLVLWLTVGIIIANKHLFLHTDTSSGRWNMVSSEQHP